jgi:DNA-binding NarL/FixJ family response regulator
MGATSPMPQDRHMPVTALPPAPRAALVDPPAVVADVLVAHANPATRLGLCEMLSRVDDLPPVGVAHEAELWRALRGRGASAVLLDAGMPQGGLVLCRRVVTACPGVAAVLCVRAITPIARLAAAIAGARAIVAETSSEGELVASVRRALRHAPDGPLTAAPAVLHRLQDPIAPRDRPIVAMLLDATPPADIAAVLGLTPAQARVRIERVLRAIGHSGALGVERAASELVPQAT